MSIHQPVDEKPFSTHPPRDKATGQGIRAVAAERRALVARLSRIVYALLGSLELLLLFRFVLKAVGASPDRGVGASIYSVTAPLIAPFIGLLPSPQGGGMVIETTTLIAMGVYALLVWGVCHALYTASVRPPVTITRSVPQSERTPPPLPRD